MCYTTSINQLHKACKKCTGECQVKQKINAMIAKGSLVNFNGAHPEEENRIDLNSLQQHVNILNDRHWT